MAKSPNVRWQESHISRQDRIRLLGHNNKVLWFTGLPSSGKSTLAAMVEKRLHSLGMLTYLLDGDNVRHGLNSNLGFSEQDRSENIRRIGEVAKLFYDCGVNVLVSFISPYRKDRDSARRLVGDDFVEILVDCPVEECEKRDIKGLYSKARKGLIKDFTGVNAPYEKPQKPEIVVDTAKNTVDGCADEIVRYVTG